MNDLILTSIYSMCKHIFGPLNEGRSTSRKGISSLFVIAHEYFEKGAGSAFTPTTMMGYLEKS